MIDILSYLKKKTEPLPQPKPRKRKKSRNTWQFSKRRPYSFLLSKDIVTELDTIAQQLGLSRSMLVEQILRAFVEQYKTHIGAANENM
jgi:hypothetical protein